MHKYLKHGIFWVLIYIFWTYMKSGGHSQYFPIYAKVNLLNLGIYMTAYYVLKHFQIKYLYNKGKIVLFVLSIIAATIVFYTTWRLNGLWWADELRGINKGRSFGSIVDYITRSVQFYSPAMVLLVIDILAERKEERIRIERLEKEKLNNELKFLKAQLNPHFLFNTLNNLYSFVINNSPKAPDMIMSLSGMLDYVLYKSQRKSVPLKEELTAIENFIGLEQIRYGDRLKVNYNTQGDTSVQVSPLLLLSLVENAFKHGASGDIDQPEINIEIKEQLGNIICKVWNSKSSYQGELNDAYKKGIGLSNVQRQLKLVYQENYDLKIEDKEKTFSVNLQLKPLL